MKVSNWIGVVLAGTLTSFLCEGATEEVITTNPDYDSGRIRSNSNVNGTGFSQWNAGAGNAGNVGWVPSGIWFSMVRFAGEAEAASLYPKLEQADRIELKTAVYWRSIAGGFPEEAGVDVAVYLVPGLVVPDGQVPNFANSFPFNYPTAIRAAEIPLSAPALRSGYSDAQDNPFSPETDEMNLTLDLTDAVKEAIANGDLDGETPWGVVYFPEPMIDQLEVDNNPLWQDHRQTVIVNGYEELVLTTENPVEPFAGPYPRETVVDVTAPPYNADPTGQTDATAALQQALDDHDGDILKRTILYLPDGTYRLTDTLRLDTHDEPNGGSGRGIVLKGQSREGVVLRLDDNASGYDDPGNAKEVLDFNEANDVGGWQFVAFRNYIFDLTIDAGSGNPGAIGLDFCANNTGGLRNVTIRSSDPEYAGHTGLYLSTLPGPQLLKHVEIVGFDWGIRTASNPHYTTTAEHLTLRNCLVGGIQNNRHSFTIRGLVAEDLGGPAVANPHRDGFVTLLDSTALTGPADAAAVVNNGYAFVRDFTSTGYQQAIDNPEAPVAAADVEEWVSDATDSLFVDGEVRSLRLPVKETPAPAWAPTEKWVSVTDFGAVANDAGDDASAVQAAIDSMKTGGSNEGLRTLYFPTGTYRFHSGVTIGPEVSHIIGCFSLLEPREDAVTTEPIFHLTGEGDLLVLEQLAVTPGYPMRATPFAGNDASRDLVLRDIAAFWGAVYQNGSGDGDLFLENVSGTSSRYWRGEPQPLPGAIPQFHFGSQSVWARQLNTEQKDLNCVNDGGTLWILGMKDEEDGTLIRTMNGGRTELLGGVVMPLDVDTVDPGYEIIDSQMSIVIAGHTGQQRDLYEVLVRETRNGETRDLLTADTANKRSYFNEEFQYVPVLPLFSTLPAGAEGFWKFGYPLMPESWVNTEQFLGWINVLHDPYVYVMDLSKYVFMAEDPSWIYVAK